MFQRIFLFLLVGLAIYNFTQIENMRFFEPSNIVATIGFISCLCGIAILGLLMLSKKIKKYIEQK